MEKSKFSLGQWVYIYKGNVISKFLIVKIEYELELIKYATELPRREKDSLRYYVVNALFVKEWNTGFDFEDRNIDEYDSSTFEENAFTTKEECKENIISKIKKM